MISVENGVINITQTHTHIRILFASVFRFKYHFIISCFYAGARATADTLWKLCLCAALEMLTNGLLFLFYNFTFAFYLPSPFFSSRPHFLLSDNRVEDFQIFSHWMWCSSAFVYRFNNHHFEWLILFHATNCFQFTLKTFLNRECSLSLFSVRQTCFGFKARRMLQMFDIGMSGIPLNWAILLEYSENLLANTFKKRKKEQSRT